MQPIVILGTGLAGYGAARELRKHDRSTPVILLSRDDGDSYYKPDLSEALTKGHVPQDLVKKPAAVMAEELDVEVRGHCEVTAIDPEAREIEVNGRRLGYRDLVLANGAQPMGVSLDGDAADAVYHVNNLSDYRAFRQALAGSRRVAIIGAGLIGCEFANDLVNAGHTVANVDPVGWPLQRFVPEALGRALQQALGEQGVEWHLGGTPETLRRDGGTLALELADGEVLAADLVLSAVGLRPDTALAAAAGVKTRHGVVVDRQLRSSDSHIYALGDVAEVEGHVLPFVMPLMNAARALGKTLAGEPTPVRYPVMPVIVKTPACPVTVYPPRSGEGRWEIGGEAPSLEARFLDPAGQLSGFALSGEAVSKRGQYLREAPPVMA